MHVLSPWVCVSHFFHHVYADDLQNPVLHPRHKLSYFKNAGWKQKSVDVAKNLVRDIFERSYKQEDSSSTVDSSDNAESSHIRKEVSHLHYLVFKQFIG